jgi:anti-anti-sigma factor
MSDEIVVFGNGEIDMATAPDFAESLVDAIRARPVTVVVDMSNVTFIDSSGLNALVRAKHSADSAGVALTLRSPNGLIRKSITLSGLDELLHTTDEDADPPT